MMLAHDNYIVGKKEDEDILRDSTIHYSYMVWFDK